MREAFVAARACCGANAAQKYSFARGRQAAGGLFLPETVEGDDFARRAGSCLDLGLGRLGAGSRLSSGRFRAVGLYVLELQAELHGGIGEGADGGEGNGEPRGLADETQGHRERVL